MLFSGRDIWRNGAFAYSGLLIAPRGFEEDGFMLKLLMAGGLYRYYAGTLAQDIIAAEWSVQVMPGFRIKRGNTEMKFFFGPEWQTHRLWPDDTGNRQRGYNAGLRMVGELWYERTPTTLIVGDASFSSIATSHSARLGYGWRVADQIFSEGFYTGPEVQYFGSDGYRQWRFGIHITSLKADAIEWSAAGGIARDSDGRSSPYVRLNMALKIMD
ncbi:MAG TPA: cellulose biosynthesis protein BcsS [Pseudolabrys sp.]|nr:cellulose biosynthesis protein BcsS [Pseudolabrys sp.]